MFSNPNPLPEIQVVSLTARLDSQDKAKSSRKRTHPLHNADLRWFKVEEFLKSCNLSPNSRKLYTRELARFLGWTELLWGELKMRHLALYKLYLMEEVTTQKGGRLSKSTVNSAIASLKSFFSWLVKCYPEVMPSNLCWV